MIMTKREFKYFRDLTWSQFIRNNLPPSPSGFVMYDLDNIFGVIKNHKVVRIMLDEAKEGGGKLRPYQHKIFTAIHEGLKIGLPKIGIDYQGFHKINYFPSCSDEIIRIENNMTELGEKLWNFESGLKNIIFLRLDNESISKEELIEYFNNFLKGNN